MPSSKSRKKGQPDLGGNGAKTLSTAVETRFAEAQSRLGPHRQQLIRAIVDHCEETCFLSTRDLAKRYGVDAATVVRTVQALAPDGITAELYDGLAALPAFSPDEDERPPGPAADLRARIAAAGALLFCTPEYAGTLPGSLKNLLDWTVGGGEIYGKPAGWVNVAVGGRGTGAEEHLAMVLRYVGAVAVDGACVRVPVPREAVGPDGIITDPAIRTALGSALSALAGAATLSVR